VSPAKAERHLERYPSTPTLVVVVTSNAVVVAGLAGILACLVSCKQLPQRPAPYSWRYPGIGAPAKSPRPNIFFLAVHPIDRPSYEDEPEGEWIAIRNTTRPIESMRGWQLRSGSTGRVFTLPDSISGTIRIWTFVAESAAGFALNSREGIWNDHDLDSAMLFNEKGELIDKFVFNVEYDDR
jgi:hypothetical protein